MIDKRLFQLTEKKNMIKLVFSRLLQLVLSIVLWVTIATEVSHYVQDKQINLWLLLVVMVGTLGIKIILTKFIEQLTYQASSELRINMRTAVMKKAFRLGNGEGQIPATTLAQLSVDGIEQLETYYARFLPQLFYCLFASLFIFSTLFCFAWKPALVLLVCMPLIPLIIMSVMKIAKRILSGYWTQYTDLGAKFHENLSGLSTLKAYNQDEMKQIEAADGAEKFRKVTMSLLSMQLNSITIMDIISYSGAALGIGIALFTYQQGSMTLIGMLSFILLSAEFFIPMRQLGSLFHVAMNGISACKKLFDYLALPEQEFGTVNVIEPLAEIVIEKASFTYSSAKKLALQDISLSIKRGEFTALVGKSGSGKSTLMKLIVHQFYDYQGSIKWNTYELRELSKETVQQKAVFVDNHGFLYPTTIKANLLLGNKKASDKELWAVLEQVQLAEFVKNLSSGLDTTIEENGGNLSGGQRQRLLLARALLRNAELYVFDEITSGVDLKSEEIILTCLKKLSETRIVIFISHRLYNVLNANQVIVFEKGEVVSAGNPDTLQKESSYFKNYFRQEKRIIDGGEQ